MSNVLFVGPSESGKTALFAKVSSVLTRLKQDKLAVGVFNGADIHQLTQDTLTQTHTSVLPSSTTVSLAPPSDPETSKPVRLVDLPGHPRLRDVVKSQLREADGVVFVVDVQGIVRNAGQVAEYVFDSVVGRTVLTRRQGASASTDVFGIAIAPPIDPAQAVHPGAQERPARSTRADVALP